MVIEIAAGDDLTDIVYSDYVNIGFFEIPSLLDKERNEYVYEQKVGDENTGYSEVALGTKTGNLDADPGYIYMFLFRDEKAIQEMVDYYHDNGIIVTWEYAEEKDPEITQKGSYILHVVDQYGEPVPGVMVNFCTNEACTMAAGDENGVITFDGEKADYHVQVLKVPDGYSVDPEFEMQTGNNREWIVIVRKD